HRLTVGDGPVALGEFVLELGQLAVTDLGDPLEVAGALGPLGLRLELVDARHDLLDALERLLLLRPARGEPVAALLCLGELALDRLAGFLRLLAHPCELDLELTNPPLGLVELER